MGGAQVMRLDPSGMRFAPDRSSREPPGPFHLVRTQGEVGSRQPRKAFTGYPICRCHNPGFPASPKHEKQRSAVDKLPSLWHGPRAAWQVRRWGTIFLRITCIIIVKSMMDSSGRMPHFLMKSALRRKEKRGEGDSAKQRLQMVCSFLHCLGVRKSVKSGGGLFYSPKGVVVTVGTSNAGAAGFSTSLASGAVGGHPSPWWSTRCTDGDLNASPPAPPPRAHLLGPTAGAARTGEGLGTRIQSLSLLLPVGPWASHFTSMSLRFPHPLSRNISTKLAGLLVRINKSRAICQWGDLDKGQLMII